MWRRPIDGVSSAVIAPGPGATPALSLIINARALCSMSTERAGANFLGMVPEHAALARGVRSFIERRCQASKQAGSVTARQAVCCTHPEWWPTVVIISVRGRANIGAQ